ncbi:MAG: hypothetical protein HYR85_23070, partial [Planctomycetes bacterium]|nr:hypothetical protein [Planctomycetota bacterium]
MKTTIASLSLGLTLALGSPAAARQVCGEWTPGLFPYAGVNSIVNSFAVFDDGQGAALYVAGNFLIAGPAIAKSIARFDGHAWSPLASGLNGEVFAMQVHDDGTGTALYVAGDFTTAGGRPANHIARWNGTTWSSLGEGLNGAVLALAVFDDGNGPALVAGDFTTIWTGESTGRVARWNGQSWSALGDGIAGDVRALATFDDGTGPSLYVGGFFQMAGGIAASDVARWDGVAWHPLGSGTNNTVKAFTTFDEGSGPSLFVAGSFVDAGGIRTGNLARWNGTDWSRVDPVAPILDTSYGIRSLAVFDDGSGGVLLAGGLFGVSRLENSELVPLVGPPTDPLRTVSALAMTTFDDGSGPRLFTGGGNVHWWNGSTWSLVNGMLAAGLALTPHDDGSGSQLFVSGIQWVDAVNMHGISRWDGRVWSSVGAGVDDGGIFVLGEHDDGSGLALYAGGTFTSSGGVAARGLARWNGSSWADVGGGVDGSVGDVVSFDDGSGPALFVGGRFTSAGGVPARNIARWNGTSWSPLGSGMSGGTVDGGPHVLALAVFDDGSGPALYAGGYFFNAGSATVYNVAKWNGSDWSPLGGGLQHNGVVFHLVVFDDGSGPALFVGGEFASVENHIAKNIAKWNGRSWSLMNGGVDTGFGGGSVSAMTVFDDGSGGALYVTGTFTVAGGIMTHDLARWDARGWSSMNLGTIYDEGRALAVFDDGTGPALFVGGFFESAGGSLAFDGNVPSTGIARWKPA